MTEQIVKELSGHSGCKIFLCQKDKIFFVRKQATGTYVPRLYKQFEKQKKLCLMIEERTIRKILTPKVLGASSIEKQPQDFSFDMQYVQGYTLTEYITKYNTIDTVNIAQRIIQSLEEISRIPDVIPGSSVQETIYRKLDSLERLLPKHQDVINKIKFLSKNLDIKPTFCHGDLSLDNIMVGVDGNIYFLDLLDSFLNSWIMDIAKIQMDLEANWSMRGYTLDSNVMIKRKMLLDMLMETFKDYEKEISYFKILHALRILPYAADVKSLETLNTYINSFKLGE